MCLGSFSPNNQNPDSFLREGLFISWNCRGITNKKEELQILVKDLMPIAILVQETKLKENQNFHLKNYNFEHQFQPINEEEKAKGRVGICIRKEIPYVPINLISEFQTIAIQLSLHKKITICSIYIPPEKDFSQTDLEHLIQQLPKPFILTGDLNSHN